MKAYLATRLSEHLAETPEGYLIARNAILCRTAVTHPQEYRGDEIGLPLDEMVDVYRPEDEVYADSFLASLEGKALTEGHPSRFLDTGNTSWHQRGHLSNIRIGPPLPNGEGTIIGDIIITDPATIEKVKNGQLRELSVGYSCDYLQRTDGSYQQHHLVANHVALVASGRAGEQVRIQDSKGRRMHTIDELIRRIHGLADSITRQEQSQHRSYTVADDDPDLIPVPVADHRPPLTYEQQSGREFEQDCRKHLRQEIVAEPAPTRQCRAYDSRRPETVEERNGREFERMCREALGKPVKVHER